MINSFLLNDQVNFVGKQLATARYFSRKHPGHSITDA